jgi:hypothetical protein
MSIQVFKHIKEALANLNPEEIRRHAERPVRLFLYAHSDQDYRRMEDFFAPPELSQAKRQELRPLILRASEGFTPESGAAPANDLEFSFEDSPLGNFPTPNNVFAFYAGNPARTVSEVLRRRPDLAVPLAMHILPFRQEVSNRIIKKVARENAIFALATAIPDIIPFVSLPWAVGEFASDTAVLTANQIRMAFLLAAASDRDFGYREQRSEIASVVLGAFGWRALARELVGKIPMGGGLIPKAAIAYAGTRVAGLSLERFYRIGAMYTRDERRLAYQESLDRGRTIAASLLNGLQRRLPGRT